MLLTHQHPTYTHTHAQILNSLEYAIKCLMHLWKVKCQTTFHTSTLSIYVCAYISVAVIVPLLLGIAVVVAPAVVVIVYVPAVVLPAVYCSDCCFHLRKSLSARSALGWMLSTFVVVCFRVVEAALVCLLFEWGKLNCGMAVLYYGTLLISSFRAI